MEIQLRYANDTLSLVYLSELIVCLLAVVDYIFFSLQLTADQLAEAGIDLQNLEGAQVVQLAEGQQYVQGEDGQIYIIESEDAAAGGGFIDANAVVSGLPE